MRVWITTIVWGILLLAGANAHAESGRIAGRVLDQTGAVLPGVAIDLVINSRSRGTTVWTGEIGYRVSSKARIVLEAFNLLNAEVSDIDYFYSSRLPGEPEAIEGIHTHPALPRSARIGLQLTF